MTKRYVTLGDGSKIGLGKYVEAWKQCLALPPDTWIGRGVSGSGETAGEALRRLRDGMNDRINRHDPAYGVGRKWAADWFYAAWRLSRDVNTPRLVVRWAPPEFRERLAGRLRQEDME